MILTERHIIKKTNPASDGRLINADVNGALNILKKVIGKFEYDSIKVCSTPLVVTP